MNLSSTNDPESIIPISRSSTEVFKTGSWSARRPKHVEKVSPCRVACPAGNNIPRALMMAAQGDLNGALEALLEESPLPGVCGSVCYHPCQADCNRGQWDLAVSIRALERAVSDHGSAQPQALTNEGKDHPVAVVGAGPAGLAASYHLARMGHPVALYEANTELGGALMWAIPEFRLPKNTLEKDLERILSLGIDVHTGTAIDGDSLKEIKGVHTAVFLAVGAGQSRRPEIVGVDSAGVVSALELLRNVRGGDFHTLPKNVLVIGGGNVAIDAALTARRIGAETVRIVCLEQREQMPAHEEEYQQALEAGIPFDHGWGPKRILKDNDRVQGAEFSKCIAVFDEDGSFNPVCDDSVSLDRYADLIVLATGQKADLGKFVDSRVVSAGTVDCIEVNERTLETAQSGIFAGGDAVRMPGSVVDAIAAGKRAALAIHLYTRGMAFDEAVAMVQLGKGPPFSIHSLFHPRSNWEPQSVVRFDQLEPLFLDRKKPVVLERLNAELRLTGFDEVNLPLDRESTIAEAGRCFGCGTCSACERCLIFCPDICINTTSESGPRYEADPDYCKGCSVCAAVCPRGVMEMSEGK
jgi:NADPH-dependent glutamate synthase beta subunit-like oxidoreductase